MNDGNSNTLEGRLLKSIKRFSTTKSTKKLVRASSACRSMRNDMKVLGMGMEVPLVTLARSNGVLARVQRKSA